MYLLCQYAVKIRDVCKTLVFLLISSYSVNAYSVEATKEFLWVEWKKNNDLSVTYRKLKNKPLIEIKAKITVNSSISGFILFLQDTQHITNWLDNVKSSHVVEQISPQENTFITHFNSFWPVTERYMVVTSRYSQHSNLHLEIKVEDNPLEKYKIKDKIKIEVIKAHWLITPKATNVLTIEYSFIADAKGTIPFWLIKRLQLNSIWKTMNSLKEQLPHSTWQSQQLPHIIEVQ